VLPRSVLLLGVRHRRKNLTVRLPGIISRYELVTLKIDAEPAVELFIKGAREMANDCRLGASRSKELSLASVRIGPTPTPGHVRSSGVKQIDLLHVILLVMPHAEAAAAQRCSAIEGGLPIRAAVSVEDDHRH